MESTACPEEEDFFPCDHPRPDGRPDQKRARLEIDALPGAPAPLDRSFTVSSGEDAMDEGTEERVQVTEETEAAEETEETDMVEEEDEKDIEKEREAKGKMPATDSLEPVNVTLGRHNGREGGPGTSIAPGTHHMLNVLSHYYDDHVILGVDTWEHRNRGDRRCRLLVAVTTSFPNRLRWCIITTEAGELVPQSELTLIPMSATLVVDGVEKTKSLNKLANLTSTCVTAVAGEYFIECAKETTGGYRLVHVTEGRLVQDCPPLAEGLDILSAMGAIVRGESAFLLLGGDKSILVLIPALNALERVFDFSDCPDQPLNLSTLNAGPMPAALVLCQSSVWILDMENKEIIDSISFGDMGIVQNTDDDLVFPASTTKAYLKLRDQIVTQFQTSKANGKIRADVNIDDYISFNRRAKTVTVCAPPTQNRVEAAALDHVTGRLAVAFTKGLALYSLPLSPENAGNPMWLHLNDTVSMFFRAGVLFVVHQTGEINVFDAVKGCIVPARTLGAGPFFHGPVPTQLACRLVNGRVAFFSHHGAIRVVAEKVPPDTLALLPFAPPDAVIDATEHAEGVDGEEREGGAEEMETEGESTSVAEDVVVVMDV